MSLQINANVQNLKQKLFYFLNNKDFINAEKLIKKLLIIDKSDATLWHLKSVIHHNLGDIEQCRVALKKSLKLDPKLIPALQNQAKLLKQDGNVKQAITAHNKILSIDKNNLDSLYNLGVLFNRNRQSNDALSVLNKANQLKQNDLKISIAIGQTYLHLNLLLKAQHFFEQALKIQPNSTPALNNLGLVFKKKCLYKEAIACFIKALSLTPGNSDITKNLASCYTLIGDIEKSKCLYQQLLDKAPLDIDAHNWLNKMLWEHADTDFLKSYQLAMKSNSGNSELEYSYALKLKQSENIELAEDVLKNLLQRDKKHLNSLLELSSITNEQSKFDQSVSFAKEADKIKSNAFEVKLALGKSLLSVGEYNKALSMLNKLLKQQPNHQGLLAYKTVALRGLNDAEYDYLCDYEKFILSAHIDLPAGFHNLSEFNHSLAAQLRTIHLAKSHPLDQSLISGSQTSENLFDYHLPIIKTLFLSLKEQTSEFLSKLPKDSIHPLLARNTQRFVESDSWSVLLNNSGYHKNHYHSAGWMSSCYYVQVPKTIIANSEQQGWINFGEPGFNMAEKLSSEISIEPQAGLMVQFPSYFWHGTTPFNSDEQRITTPYDIVPI
ncbi:putative 2OG-Fe(II) oxygenase [Thalassotalea fonticola]|uniref:2OG-Fe(II) oxygenase n=1 Tax=Thalassotalea fonticola TaxID=3065649 RepID=A0ABZ0GNZ1_9GAMM|nr:putative 2OG-Fe(II) oxygenase [Colwelliaceae bacterium S1-1]